MCLPVAAIAMISAGTAAAGTAVSVMGQRQQAKATEAQAGFQAQVDASNAVIAEQMAADVRKRGKETLRRHRGKVSQMKGAQRTALAKSGVVIDTGSALDIVADTAYMGELDALTIKSNVAREAFGFERRAAGFRTESELSKRRGKSAKRAGRFGMATTLLQGGSSVAGKWLDYKER